jgi:hypothetical protein
MTQSKVIMRGALRISVALVCISIAACGGRSDLPSLGNVIGTVTVDGQPVPNGAVQFTPVEGGRTSSGITDSSGQYSLMYTADTSGAQLGKHEVRLAPSAEAPSDDQMDLSSPQGGLAAEHMQRTFEFEVQSGRNTFDIVLP